MSSTAYRDKVINWRKEREENLRKENGWLALCGLYWLKPGVNILGSAMDCEIKLPDRFPARLGTFEQLDDGVYFHPDLEFRSQVNILPDSEGKLTPDVEENPSFINFEKMTLGLIRRGNRTGIRMWDNSRAERRDHPPRTWYEIDESYRFPGMYHPFTKPEFQSFPDVFGEFQDLEISGSVTFENNNHPYNLIVSKETDETLFLRFWDKSSESTSYPAGRYLVLKPARDKRVELDFNFAYNPPCAFTPYATCVFAPQQNRLDFSILAGETYVHTGFTESH